MLRSMYSGVSGLQAHQKYMDVIGNNIGNVNTHGFKKSRVTFNEMMSQTLSQAQGPQNGKGGINPRQIGLGTQVGSIDDDHSQGGIQTTDLESDLALEGDGYFVVDNGQQELYTRNGNFSLDENGEMVSAANGNKLQGWNAVDGEVDTGGSLENVKIPRGDEIKGEATGEVQFGGNLNSNLDDGISQTGTIDITDSLGKKHTATLDFVRNIGSNLGGEHAFNDDEIMYFEQEAFDPEMEGINITFNQMDNEELNVGYENRELTVTADFNDDTLRPDAKTLENAINNQLDKNGFSGPLSLSLSEDTAFENFDGSALDGINIEIKGTEIGEQQATITQDFNNNDENLNNMEVQFTGDDSINDISGNYNVDDHKLYIDLAAGEDFSDSEIETAINETLEDNNLEGRINFNTDDSNPVSLENNESTSEMKLTASNHWDWELDGVTDVIENSASGSGRLSFDSRGILRPETASGSIEFNPLEVGSPVQEIDIDFGDETNPISQQSAPSTVRGLEADGFEKGELDSYSIGENGQITGSYTNGMTRTLGQIAVSDFSNPAGLEKRGETLFAASENSGSARLGIAGTEGRGSMASGSLEESNVDLAEEFSRMITTQRGFQANSRTISTSDEMLQELVNLRR